jgi:hypothetical protein
MNHGAKISIKNFSFSIIEIAGMCKILTLHFILLEAVKDVNVMTTTNMLLTKVACEKNSTC